MDEFYEAMDLYLNHERRCFDCGEKMWVCYGDGHIWDKCLACPEPPAMTLQELADGDGNLELAGYITRYDEPNEPPPDTFEVKTYNDWHGNKKHERAYRKI